MKTRKTFCFLFLNLLLLPAIVLGQYVFNPKMVYPVNKGLNAAYNFTLTKTHDQRGYLMVSDVRLNNHMAGTAIEINNMLDLTWHASGIPVLSSDYSKLIVKDVIASSDGAYIGCGLLSTEERQYAFIAKGSKDSLTYLWVKIYPLAHNFNSIIEVKTPDNRKERYIVCGESFDPYFDGGVLMCTNIDGDPIWQKHTVSGGKTDRFVYNQVVQLGKLNSPSNAPYFVAVGNAITTEDRNQDVLVSLFDVRGNDVYNLIYGLPNNNLFIYTEQGYGVTQYITEDGEPTLIICGRTRCQYRNSSRVRWEDVLLFSTNVWNGRPRWQNRYDVRGNNQTGEYGQKVIIRREKDSDAPYIYVTGYQRGKIFNPNGSVDAFIFKTKINGSPIENRVFGSSGQDYLYKLMVNNKRDGIIAAGYSNSFGDSLTRPSYAPFVIESYLHYLKPCYDVVLRLPVSPLEMKISKIRSDFTNLEVKRIKVKKAPVDVSRIVICPKIPTIIPVKSAETSQLDNDTELMIYPTIVKDKVKVSGIQDQSDYQIYNMSGKVLLEGNINNNDEVNVSELSKGIYIFMVIEKENIKTCKLIK